MSFIRYKKVYYLISGILAVSSIISLLAFGLNFGIDFTGGSILELDFEQRPENAVIQEKLASQDLGEVIVQPTKETEVLLKLKSIDEDAHQRIISSLNEVSPLTEKRFESIGPLIGRELREKTMVIVILAVVLMLIYITFSFRRVSRPISSWKYGIISIVALSFDVLVSLGIFSYLGKTYNIQFNLPIVTAILTILGYTINDKIIVFDRIRENLLRSQEASFELVVDKSFVQVLSRSLSTGTCTLLVLFFILFLGGETLRYFALTLIAGILIGTYSSLFLAAPLLVSWLNFKRKI